MADAAASAPGAGSWKLGCGLATGGLVLALALGATVGWGWYQARRDAERVAQEQAAEEAFAPAKAKLAEASAAPVDLDRTVRILHGLDRALGEQRDLPGYLQELARQDYRGVPPEVLKSRAELLEILQELYGKQLRAEDQQALWEVTSELLLSTLSVVQVSAEVDPLAPSGGFAVDRKQAQKVLADLKRERQEHQDLLQDIEALEGRLFDALMAHNEVYWKYLREWDALVIQRDRAYLAIRQQDWPAAIEAARSAIALAPGEREAHLLLAQALIEQGNPETVAEVDRLLAETLEAHPDQSAPTLLLAGVNRARAGGDRAAAQLALQQSAAYYPRQSAALLDLLDPYQQRAYLKKSREGSYILELYQATMTGAGYYSPDLQLARLAFDSGDFNAGKAKVLDHFARRRTQEQWEYVLSDVAFCHELLGPQFWQILPENAWLDLEVSPTLLGGALNLAVRNRSERTLHNATLVLALHLTDMVPSDYAVVRVPDTAPAVLPHDTTSFGSVKVAVQVNGVEKGVEHVVHHRAILIADEAVSWVDTDAYKIAEAEEFRSQRRAAASLAARPEHPALARHPELEARVDRLAQQSAAAVRFETESRFGPDDVLVQLPRELSLLRPLFRLRRGDQLLPATENLIEGDYIKLRFRGVGAYDGEEGRQEDLELVASTPFGELVLTWRADNAVVWRFE